MPESLVTPKNDPARQQVIEQLDADLGRLLLTADNDDKPCYLADLIKVDPLRSVDRIGMHLAHGLLVKSLDDEGNEMPDAYDITQLGHKFFTAAAKKRPARERVTAAPAATRTADPARRPRGGASRKGVERSAGVLPASQSRRDRARRTATKGPQRRR